MDSVGASKEFNLFSGYHNIINGKLSSTEETRHGINPATEKPNPPVPVSTQQDVNDAVAAAKEAFKSWSKTPFSQRKNSIIAFSNALEQHKQEFSKLLTQEQGKPVSKRLRSAALHS